MDAVERTFGVSQYDGHAMVMTAAWKFRVEALLDEKGFLEHVCSGELY